MVSVRRQGKLGVHSPAMGAMPRRRSAMKVADIMTTRPLCVGPDERPGELRRLMEAAQVHHLPLVSEGRLVGLWLATDEGPLVMLAPERAYETGPGTDAREALEALLGGQEAVVVWDKGERPAGLITRADAVRILRGALDMGLGRRHIRPVVLRLVGPAGAGKSTLMVRTIERLRRCEVAVVQANAEARQTAPQDSVAGAPMLEASDAHWAKGLDRCIRLLDEAQFIIVEDRDGPPELGPGLGEDLQVLVVRPQDLESISPGSLKDAQAVVITQLDLAPAGFNLASAVEGVHVHAPHLPVFGVAPLHDDRGLVQWQHWLEGRVLPRQH
jgi:CBS domain-containing protein